MARVLHPDDAAEIAEYVQSRGFKRVALQVPDGRALRDAPLLAAAVRAALSARRRRRQQQPPSDGDNNNKEHEEEELFILADTSANPLAVDEVAAAHVDAHCVVHFGPASLTRTSRTPALCVLPRRALLRFPPAAASPAAAAGRFAAPVPVTSAVGSPGGEAAAVVAAGEEEAGARAGGGGGGQGGAREKEEEEDEQGNERGALAMAALIAAQLREEAAAAAADGTTIRAAVVLLDQGYMHALPRVEAATLGLLLLLPRGKGDDAAVEPPPLPPLPWPVSFARPLPRVLEPEEGVAECLSLQRRPGGAAVAGPASAPDAAEAAGATAAAPAAAAAAADAPYAAAAAAAPVLTGAGLQWSLPGGASRSDTLLLWVGPLVDSDASAATAEAAAAEATTQATAAAATEEREAEREEAAAAAAAGPAAAPLARLQLVYSDAPWRSLDPRLGPASSSRGTARTCQLLRRRRRFAVSAAHGAPMVGVLVGTLGAAGFRDAVSAVRALAVAAGKRPYILLVGKPNPAKLANFPELGCFVHVTDPEGALLLAAAAGGGAGAGGCGGGYLAPVVTPHEAAVAFGAAARGLDAYDAVALLESRPYSLGFDTVVREAEEVAAEAAAGGGGRGGGGSGGDSGGVKGGGVLAAMGGGAAAAGGTELAPVQAAGDILARGARVLAAYNGERQVEPATAAEFLLLRRGYRGLETPAATGAPEKRATLASEGRLGRAAGYDEEGER